MQLWAALSPIPSATQPRKGFVVPRSEWVSPHWARHYQTSSWDLQPTASAKGNEILPPRTLVLHSSCQWESPCALLETLLSRKMPQTKWIRTPEGRDGQEGFCLHFLFSFFNISILHSTLPPWFSCPAWVENLCSREKQEGEETSLHSKCSSHPQQHHLGAC